MNSSLPDQLRSGRQYGLVGDPSVGRFHILDPASFPAAFECGLYPVFESELVDFHPDDQVCSNCVTVVSLKAVADEINKRMSTSHERVDCPRCRAPRGDVCRSMPAGYSRRPGESGRPLKHSHAERHRADGVHIR